MDLEKLIDETGNSVSIEDDLPRLPCATQRVSELMATLYHAWYSLPIHIDINLQRLMHQLFTGISKKEITIVVAMAG